MLPYLQEVQKASKSYTVTFRGLNYGEGAQDGEFAETENLSTDQYPCITQRAARIRAGVYTRPTTLHSKGNLLIIDGTQVYYGDKSNPVGEVTLGKKQTATVGNYIVIFPDKKYYKVPTEDENGAKQEGEFGSMEATYKGKGFKFTDSMITIPSGKTPFRSGDEVTISGCKIEGNNKEKIVVTSASENELVFEDNTFEDTTEYGAVTIKREDVVFESSSTLYFGESNITAHSGNDKFPFKSGDVVKISGSSAYPANNKEFVVIKSASDNELVFDTTFLPCTMNEKITITRVGVELTFEGLPFTHSTITMPTPKLRFKEGDAVTITGCSESGNDKAKEILIRGVTENDGTSEILFDANAFTAVGNEPNEVTISRTVPDLEFICESNLRLWGTKGNNIYTSKYDDPMNFKVFDNLSSDSWEIEEGGDGDFTGCIPYGTHICFFKENMLVKLYGNKPSNYSLTRANVFGVQRGSEKSMQIVNEQLLYKGVGGVYAYTGGVPELISGKFGNNRYSDAVACCDGEKYYISMRQGDKWSMFVYDVLKNIWLREDDTYAVDMTFFDGKVYYLDAEGSLYYIDKTADRNDIEWSATFCTMHETMNERKGYSKFHLRMDMSAGAWLEIDIKTDNDLKWKKVYTTHNEKAKTVSIPIMPTRCDSIDIRLRGKGKCTIKTFIREFTVGSDV